MKGDRFNPLWSRIQPCLVLVSGCLALSGTVAAGPHVAGYERFHADAPTVEGGAVLFSELGCASCHGGSAVVVPRQGPHLVDLASRVDREWVREFLKDPETGREGSPMPQMVHGLAAEEVDAVVTFLGSLGKGIKYRPERHANAERGSALYHEKGCIACHAPTPDFHPPHGDGKLVTSPLAIPHPDLKKKTSLEALTLFLSAPSNYRPDGRMPHFLLDNQEALDIASHLMDFQASDPREAASVKNWPAGDPEKIAIGKEIVTRLNCASCHTIPGVKAPGLVALSGDAATAMSHCLSEAPVAGLPHYRLDDGQRASLAAFLKGERPVADKDGKLTLAAMNCYACHDRDGIGGPTVEANPYFVGDEGIGDSGRLAPPLTGIGHKLRRDWMEDVFAGVEGSRVRPYVKTQMPVYPAHAAALTEWLDRIDAKPDAIPLTERKEDLEAGRKLLGIHGGVNCITCHNWGEKKSLGIAALDISSLDKRLRPEWFRSYLINPAEYRAGTLMPPLWPGGQSMVPDVLGGDTDRQIAAIWSFIREGEGLPEGFPDRSSGLYEIVPADRAVIQRTFLEGVGTKAILVGFPGGISLAYDGDKSRPALIWRGGFFDAYQTWYSRHAPFEKPLSDEVYAFPESASAGAFRGYRVDESGNPTFLIRDGKRELSESFSVADGKLIRVVRWTQGEAPALVHPAGVAVEATAGEGILTSIYTWK